MSIYSLVVVLGLAIPIILVPIVRFTGYSEILEELAKAFVVLFVISRLFTFKQKLIAGVFFGFLFGLSENLFYLSNFFQIGDFSNFWMRFIYTLPMHILTVLVLILSIAFFKKKYFVGFGLAGAIIIHYVFNFFVFV